VFYKFSEYRARTAEPLIRMAAESGLTTYQTTTYLFRDLAETVAHVYSTIEIGMLSLERPTLEVLTGTAVLTGLDTLDLQILPFFSSWSPTRAR
jgi:hypothetical protein